MVLMVYGRINIFLLLPPTQAPLIHQPKHPTTSSCGGARPAQKFARAPMLLGAAPRFGGAASTSGGTISGPRARAAAFARPRPAPPRSRHVPRACAGCRIIDRPVSGAGRGRENRAAPQSAATVSGPDRWAGAGGRRLPHGPARTSGRYGSGARCSIGASAKVIFGTGPLGFDDEMAIAVLVAHGNRG